MAEASDARISGSKPLVLLTTILASSLAFIDGSVVNVGLPSIDQALHGGAEGLQWVVNGYLIPLTALLLLGGAAGDRFGHKRMLIGGVGVFGAASLFCAVAPSLFWLILGRLLQGAGAAMLLPNSLAVLGGAFSESEARGRAIGAWAASSSIAGAIGPMLGGWLIDATGWRAIFLINVPLALLAIVLAWLAVGEAPRHRTAGGADLLGAVFTVSGLALITWGLTEGSGRGGWGAPASTAVALGIAALVAFVKLERRRATRAILPLSIFVSRRFVGLTLLTILLYGALSGFLLIVPNVLIYAAGYSATAAGAALLPFSLGIAALSPTMGRLAGRMGAAPLLIAGPLVVGMGILLSARIGGGGTYWSTVFPAIFVVSLGMSAAVAPLTTAVLASVDDGNAGVASAFNSAVARAGGLVATALLGAVILTRGQALVVELHSAALIGAVACIGASASALLVRTRHLPKPAAKQPTAGADSDNHVN